MGDVSLHHCSGPPSPKCRLGLRLCRVGR